MEKVEIKKLIEQCLNYFYESGYAKGTIDYYKWEVIPRTGGRMGNGLLQPPPGLRILILVHHGFGLVAHAFSHVLDGFLASFAGVFHLVLAFLHFAGSGIVRTSAALIHMILGFAHNKQIFLLFIV